MTVKFAHLIELFERLEQARFEKAVTGNRPTKPDHQAVREWFRAHNHRISRHGPAAVALLSCVFPERLSQRSYNLREQSLSHIIPRILIWGSSRARTLRDWVGGGTDFAVLVETEMKRSENASPLPRYAVTVEEVDAALLQLAANSPYSGPRIRQGRNSQDACDILTPIFRRLKSHEAKWLVRLLLKDFKIIRIPEKPVMGCFHFLLPELLTVACDLEGAVEFLSRDIIRDWPLYPSIAEEKRLKQEASKIFQPQVGTMIPRMAYDKARSIKHAVKLANNRVMSVERKYDGEYCQIHIRREPDKDTIQIFSKSGKDSTLDRHKLHKAIALGLDLAGDSCRIKSHCILEGELLVWSKSREATEPFYKIRNHVKHGGKFLGNMNDPAPDRDEQLLVMFYDVLALDDLVNTTTPHELRRQHLKGLVRVLPGVSDVAERLLIDFKHLGQPRTCMRHLREFFARAIVSKWEGLVLKGRDDPYLSFVSAPRGIKLKRDYLAQLGDAADLCIIGASLDSRIDNPDSLKWNTFYLACLDNKEAVQRFGEAPSFSIVDKICDGAAAIPKDDLLHLNYQGVFRETDFNTQESESRVKMLAQGEAPTVLFRRPFVVECLGAGFDKNSDCVFWTLRFPRLTRIHHDRPLTETMSLEELQQAAETAHIAPALVDEHQVQVWIEKLSHVDGKNAVSTAKMISQSTASTGRTPRSASTASLSPVAPRNRPPSLPLIWKDVTKAAKVLDQPGRDSLSQNTTTTSTRTPSTTRTSASVQAARVTVLATVAEVEQKPPASRLQSPPLSSPIPAGPGLGKRRACNAFETAISSKRLRTIAGRTILKTPTPPRNEIDLTSSVSPVAVRSVGPVVSGSNLKLTAARQERDHFADPGPIPIPLPRFKAPQRQIGAETGGPAHQLGAVEWHQASDASSRRTRTSFSNARKPLAELPSKSPVQKAPPPPPPEPSASLMDLTEDREQVAKQKEKTMITDRHQQLRIEPITAPLALLTPPSTEEAARKDEPGTEKAATSTTAHAPAAKPHRPADLAEARKPGPMSHRDRLAAARTRTRNHSTVAGPSVPQPQAQPPAVPGTPSTSPILRMPSASDAVGPVSELMSRTSSTFTSDRTLFLKRAMRCGGTGGQKHVVLVDSSADAKLIAAEVRDLAREAVRVAEEEQLSSKAVICIFDWRILRCRKRRGEMRRRPKGQTHECFVCAVHLEERHEKTQARIVWRD